MFSNNTADCGWAEETVGLLLRGLEVVSSTFHPLRSASILPQGLTGMKQLRGATNMMTYEGILSLFFDFLMLLKSQFQRNLWGFF